MCAKLAHVPSRLHGKGTTQTLTMMAWKEQICIREAVVDDAPSILWLIQLLAEYEKEPDSLHLEAKDIARDCFGKERLCFPLVAELKSPPPATTAEDQPLSGLPSEKMERNECIVAYGLYFYNYSTWVGRYVYLEDIFVREKYRNLGLGTALMKECAKIALSEECVRMKFQVLDWNTKAIDLYKKLGGEITPEFLTMRMYRDDITKLAASEADGSWREHVILRPAVPEDVPEVKQLIQMLADYLKESHGPKIGERELLQDGFNGQKHYGLLVAEIKRVPSTSDENTTESSTGKTEQAKLAGFALYCFSYSTWDGRQMYLDDLFVREKYRRMGVGKAFLRECAKVAVATNCARIYWHVLDFNTEAIKFYERNGGQLLKEWLTVNMEKDSLANFVTEKT